MKTYILEQSELSQLVTDFLGECSEGVVLLRGDLAAGKTTLTREIAKALGYTADVTSPTFSLQHQYTDELYHYDLYNHGFHHFLSLGMLEELEKSGLHLVEWGDEALEDILRDAGIPVRIIEIEKISDTTRKYKVHYAHA
ncbi:MAG: tRNA (adenosine(37)-N6)-threonylcarbamoyltransferase complex ATPase subunit type 1 TsaE [Sulfurimonadaceae bacterium]|jgi:tRNA threonylcarbamoyladenosine biosynthesis protein TsaE|nr:tRNA (adenosine(37)-N6)-threonylcarbamoyltransferase complex ATPase subunit type 1 TsaE [Sulfurimonadaceae bacterium]